MTHLPTLPLLEFLTPPAGWRTDRALLSSYSADLAVVVAFILALAARSDDAGAAGCAALARALKELKGRCKFVVQRGRISEPSRSSTILGLLDQFVVEVPWDEADHAGQRGRSWHAKIALARYVGESDSSVPARWCLWLGSRNLSRDESWDIGLSLKGTEDRSAAGVAISSIAELAERLSAQAGQSTEWVPLLTALKRVKWDVPRGLSIEEIRLAVPEDGSRKRRLPTLPKGVRRVLAVAPFLDGGTVKKIADGAPDAQARQLLSTRRELSKLAEQALKPLSGFSLLVMPEPSDAAAEPPSASAGTLDAAVEDRGLHAKFLWVEHAAGASLWLGSPNLTDRAWSRNAEAYAKVDVEFRGSPAATKALVDGIEAFVGHARNLKETELAAAAAEDVDDQALEVARKQVSARLGATQTRQGNGTVLVYCSEAPHPDDTTVDLEVGRLSGSMVPWPAASVSVTLPAAEEARDSDLLRVRLKLADRSLTWVQRAPFDPPLNEARDDAALRDYLGVRGLLALIADLLTDLPSSGDTPWDLLEDERQAQHRGRVLVSDDLPTLEQILRASVRDPNRVRQAAAVLRLAKAAPLESNEDKAAAVHLQRLLKSWEVLERFVEQGARP